MVSGVRRSHRSWPVAAPVGRYGTIVFLDRDGVLTADTGYAHRIDQQVFLGGAVEAVVALSELPVHIVVVSNQAGIAKGLYAWEDFAAFNEAILQEVRRQGGRIDAFYGAPYLEASDLDAGSMPSPFLKPGTGMLCEAAVDLGTSAAGGWMVGDKLSDVQAGHDAGCRTVRITGRPGAGGDERGIVRADVEPNCEAASLHDALPLLLAGT